MTMPYGSGFSPLLGEPRSGTIAMPTRTPYLATLTTGGGVVTITAANLLGGLLIINCDDAQTLTLPTATLLNAAIPSCAVGASFEVDVINTGDTTLTIAVGTGGTLAVGSNSKNSVATIVSNASKRFIIRVSGVTQNGDASDAYVVYGFGSVAAAVA